MRTYAYVRINPDYISDIDYIYFFQKQGFNIPINRIMVEEVSIEKSIAYREKLINLINYSLESGDRFVFKSLDCLGANFFEIFQVLNGLEKKKIKIVCLDFSKDEIEGNLKIFFFHFIKLCTDFEELIKKENKSRPLNENIKKVGRPEKLTEIQKMEVIDKFKKGYTIYSLAKEYSVTRTVIQRLIGKISKKLN